MSEYETTVEVYQAQNAVQIAQAGDAGKYAPEIMRKAEEQLDNARSLQAQRADKSLVIMAAREAAQTAEDARTLAAGRAKDAALAQAQANALQQQQLRMQAEAQARQAEAKAARAVAQSSADRAQLDAVQQAQSTPPPPPPPAAPVAMTSENAPAPPPPIQNDRKQRELRVSLLQQVNGYFPARDTPQGLVVTIPDVDFRGVSLDEPLMTRVERIAALVFANPGLNVEVDGFTDSASPEAERIATARAGMVRDALRGVGLASNAITVRSLGNSRPLGSNATAQGREQNRRVEIVISGAPIGNLASWDKSYPVIPQ
jgi:flagellar motor protein MotB